MSTDLETARRALERLREQLDAAAEQGARPITQAELEEVTREQDDEDEDDQGEGDRGE